MKAHFAAALAAAFFVPVSIGMADAAPPVIDNGVVGILSPNGTFKPLYNSIVQTSTQTNKFFTGTINTTITIAVVSPIPPGSPVQCSVSASVTGTSATGLQDVVLDSASSIATGAGATLTCVTAIPYKWGLFANTGTPTIKDSVTMTYQITAIGATGNRITSSTFDVMTVPATGATTTFAVSARI